MGEHAAGERDRLDEALVEQARAAYTRAYAPYSHYRVGAALRSRAGVVYPGCNVENAVYPLTTCAERSAVVRAVTEGERDFEAIAIVTRDGGSPCGACRQTLREFNAGDLRVILATPTAIVGRYTLDELLPRSFAAENLERGE